MDEAARLLKKSIIHVEGPEVNLAEAPRFQAPAKDDESGGSKKSSASEAKKPKKPLKKFTLQFEEYEQAANTLVLLLRRRGEGMKQINLLQEYLNMREAAGQIQNESALIRETMLLRAVIQRMLTKDSVLILILVRSTFFGLRISPPFHCLGQCRFRPARAWCESKL